MKQLIYTLLLIGLLTSCDNKKNKGDDYLYQISELKLNNGKKWQANRANSKGIAKMEKIIDTLDVKTFNPAKVSYYLNREITMMMTMCGIAGEAHDQFHNYVIPLREQINGLQLANDIAKEPLLASIRQELVRYERYFK